MSKMVKKSENSKIIKKSLSLKKTFFEKNNFARKKRGYSLSFPLYGGCDSTRALQSTRFQNPGGGSPERNGVVVGVV